MSGIALALLLLLGGIVGQEGDVDRDRIVRVAKAVMRSAGQCALITLDAEGRPRARAMDPFPPEKDLRVWMGTSRHTRKVQELRADPRATLYYYDDEGGSYVTLLGRVRIVDDPQQKARRFKAEWKEFYEDEHRGDDYLLLEFVPESLEVVSLEHDVAADPQAWKPAILRLEPDAPDGR